MKKLKKIVALVFLFLLLVPTVFVFANGMVVEVRPDLSYDYVKEDSQRAYINHKEGTERLIISVDIEDSEEKKLWLFPIPAHYSQIETDITKEEPRIHGNKITDQAAYRVKNISDVYLFSQIYPILSKILTQTLGRTPYLGGRGIGSSSLTTKDYSGESVPDVVIRSEIVKEGMTVQVVTARTAEGLREHFVERGLDLDPTSITALNHYVGKDDYSFIASWMNEPEKIAEQPQREASSYYYGLYQDYPHQGYPRTLTNFRARSVYVKFPSEEAYFPMILTSVYEETVVPVSLRMIGLKKIKKDSIYQDMAVVDYYSSTRGYVGDDEVLDKFFSGVDFKRGSSYTAVEIEEPVKKFTEDFYAKKGAPLLIYLGIFLNRFGIFVAVVFFGLLSFLSSIVAGYFLFPHLRNMRGYRKLGAISFFNYFSIIGFLVAALVGRPDRQIDSESPSDEVSEAVGILKEKGYDINLVRRSSGKRFFGYVALFSIVFVTLTIITSIPLIYLLKPDMPFSDLIVLGKFFQ